MAILPHVTQDSIASAKADAQAERERIFQQTGVRILEDGSIVRPSSAYLIHCPRCAFRASARSDGQAVRALAAHLVKAHLEVR